MLYVKIDGKTQVGMGAKDPRLGDMMLQPREVTFVLMFSPEPFTDGHSIGAVIAEGLLKDTHQSAVVHLSIENAPAGAWTGKLVTGESGGAVAAGGPEPKAKEAQSLFGKWQSSARVDGKIPGGTLGPLARVMARFIELNPEDERAPRFAELIKRIDTSHDWTPADAVVLLDEVTAIYEKLPQWVEEEDRFFMGVTIRTGQPLPAELANAPWGVAQPNGLRVAWLLDPRGGQHRLGTPLKSRILFHNSGKNAVVFRARTWNQSAEHKARDAQGAEINIRSTDWTTIPQVVACRLAPGEFVEMTAAGIGVGANKDDEDWRGTRVGSWIEAKEGDEVTFTPGPVVVNGTINDDRSKGEPNWWQDFITERIKREMPIPTGAADREQILRRLILDLFGKQPTPEEIEAFVADKSPAAVHPIASRDLLRVRVQHLRSILPFTGHLQPGETKFRVLAADPDAAKKPRTATGPGRYILGGNAILVVTRHPVGERIVNEAHIVFSPPEETIPHSHEIKLPDGYNTWAAAWMRDATVLWVMQKGIVRSYDFTNQPQVKETPREIAKVSEPIREALRPALGGGGNASARPAATPAP